jgi:hypothetical protein
MRKVLLTLMLCASTAAGAATVYKWVDAQGVTHYSDQPHPGAQKIEIGAVQTYSSQRPDVASAAPGGGTEEAPYSLCEIYRPSRDEVFLNTDSVTARVRLQPDLRPGDSVVLALDGRQLSGVVIGSDITVQPVFRGSHSLLLVVHDSNGNVVCQSEPVTFHVRQPSTQAPNPANRPRF